MVPAGQRQKSHRGWARADRSAQSGIGRKRFNNWLCFKNKSADTHNPAPKEGSARQRKFRIWEIQIFIYTRLKQYKPKLFWLKPWKVYKPQNVCVFYSLTTCAAMLRSESPRGSPELPIDSSTPPGRRRSAAERASTASLLHVGSKHTEYKGFCQRRTSPPTCHLEATRLTVDQRAPSHVQKASTGKIQKQNEFLITFCECIIYQHGPFVLF